MNAGTSSWREGGDARGIDETSQLAGAELGVHAAQRLVSDDWCIGFADVAVSIGEDIRYPDVLVERRQGDGRDLLSEAPILIAEILSASSTGMDLTIKLASLPSLHAYIVASQDEAIVWVWQRDGASGAFPPSRRRSQDARPRSPHSISRCQWLNSILASRPAVEPPECYQFDAMNVVRSTPVLPFAGS